MASGILTFSVDGVLLPIDTKAQSSNDATHLAVILIKTYTFSIVFITVLPQMEKPKPNFEGKLKFECGKRMRGEVESLNLKTNFDNQI